MQSTEQYRREKAERIAAVIINAAGAIAEVCTELGRHAHKKPRILSKRINIKNRKEFRKRRCFLVAQMAVIKEITRCQLLMVMSQPIPKFKPGGAVYNEKESTDASSTISEAGQELINGSFIPNTNAIHPLPSGQRDNL